VNENEKAVKAELAASFADINRNANARMDEWMKLLITLGTGALSILVAFIQLDSLSFFPSLFLNFAWVCIGLGIVFAAFRLYVGVEVSQRGAKIAAEVVDKFPRVNPSFIVKPNKFLKKCGTVAHVFFLLGVASIVAFAVSRNPLPHISKKITNVKPTLRCFVCDCRVCHVHACTKNSEVLEGGIIGGTVANTFQSIGEALIEE